MPQPSPSHLCVQPHVASSPRRRAPCGAPAPPHSPCRPTARNSPHSTTLPIYSPASCSMSTTSSSSSIPQKSFPQARHRYVFVPFDLIIENVDPAVVLARFVAFHHGHLPCSPAARVVHLLARRCRSQPLLSAIDLPKVVMPASPPVSTPAGSGSTPGIGSFTPRARCTAPLSNSAPVCAVTTLTLGRYLSIPAAR